MSTAALPTSDSNVAFTRRSELVLSLALLAILIVLLVPLPTMLLDMLIALNLGMTILLLLITLSAKEPLEVSVFPSLLLLTTLYRLALNVATTRLILLDGDAGRIVSTFGNFVVGGNLVVGLVIFLILILIQFVVITKGATRISEVNARFTLDAMPGKQMAIDAELNAGAIEPDEAKRRRVRLMREAEFYGAMDGASKYVRGDAVAGLLITAINIIGGVTLGLMNDLSIADSLRLYAVLTVGDGLVSQIPALIIATSAGILVTKASSDTSLGHEIGSQVLRNERPLWVGAVILSVLALTPGLPKLPFLLLSVGLVVALRRQRSASGKPSTTPTRSKPRAQEASVEEHVNQFLETDRLCLEIGRQLTSLVDSPTTKGLRDVLGGLRRDLTRKYGLWVPTIRVVESVDLFPNEYRILIGGREVARGNLRIDRYLAIDPGSKTTLTVDGEETADPTFGLPAKWIQASDRRRAQLAGYTVVDAPTVLITHFGEVIRRHAHELLSREDLHTMLEKVKETAQTVVEDLMKPDLIRMGVLHQVLVHLLAEGIPITNLPLILESIAHHAAYVKDPVQLTERVRGDIGRTICDRFRDERGRVRVIMFEPALELAMRDYVRDGNLALPPGPLEKLLGGLSAEWGKACLQGRPVALVVEGHIRRLVRQTILRPLSDLAVIAVNEIPGDLLIETVAMLRLGEVFVAATTGAGPRTEQPNKPSGRDGPGRRVAAA